MTVAPMIAAAERSRFPESAVQTAEDCGGGVRAEETGGEAVTSSKAVDARTRNVDPRRSLDRPWHTRDRGDDPPIGSAG